jgi:hypothetical protein
VSILAIGSGEPFFELLTADTHRFSGIGAFKASCPAAVMQYTARPWPSDRRSIHPFAIMLATVCLPDGCSFSIRCPSVGLMRCRVVLSTECGMWLGRAGISVPR